MAKHPFTLSVIASALLFSSYSYANKIAFSQTDFGGVGLIQVPSARHQDQGAFAIGATINEDYYHYFTSLQLMPWLETTIRYTQVPSRLYNQDASFSGDTIYTDKGIDVKLRLLKESHWVPELSVGIRDLSGTGLFDGEFIVANKRVHAFDFTLGVGWGYLGNRANLLGNKSDAQADCGRGTDYKGKGGSFDYSRWFKGCASLYGGLTYQTAFEPLSIKLEYEGNDYQADFIELAKPKSPINAGLVYRFGDWGDMRLSYERGSIWSFGLTLKTNFNDLSQIWLDSSKPAYSSSAETNQKTPDEIDWNEIDAKLSNVAGYSSNKIYASEDQITLVTQRQKYRERHVAQDRAAMILLNSGVKASRYSIIEQQNNQPITQTDIDALAYKKIANQEYIGANIKDAITEVPPNSPRGRLQLDTSKPWSVSLAPTLQQSFGGSEGFYMFNAGVNLGGNYWFTDNVELGGGVYVNIFDNYDKFLYEVPPDGTDLKRVRTLVRQYVTDNRVRISNLQLTAFGHFLDDFYTQTYAGYLETMFAGVGGEILYRPLHSNWAVGLDLNYVAQRDPNTQLGIFTSERHFDSKDGRDYRVQAGAFTGHASLYYRPDWSWLDGITFKVSAGQYLAEDKGVTLNVSKQFDTGVAVGAYMAKTNLSAEEYGEGSFNKGFYVSIPFDLLTVKPSVNRANIGWSPLSRDGGQMLIRKYSLFDMTGARDPKSEKTGDKQNNG